MIHTTMQDSTNQESSIVVGMEKIAMYDGDEPIAEASTFEFSLLEKRSLSQSSGDDSDRKIETEGRKSPESPATPETSFSSSGSLTGSLPAATVTPERTIQNSPWKSDSCLMPSWNDEGDDFSVASGNSYGTYDTTATSESVQDIISRLQSETDRRRRRLLRRRNARMRGGPYDNKYDKCDKLKKYASSSQIDPKLGMTVEIKE